MRHQVLLALRTHLEGGAQGELVPDEGHYAADIADVLWLDFEREEARQLYTSLPEEVQAEVLAEAEPKLVEALLEGIEPEMLARKLERIPADDGTDILEMVPEDVRHQVLCFIEPEDASDLRHLAEYEPESAGGLMTTEFITVSQDERIGDVLKRIKRDEDSAETIHSLYVTDERAGAATDHAHAECRHAGASVICRRRRRRRRATGRSRSPGRTRTIRGRRARGPSRSLPTRPTAGPHSRPDSAPG